MPETNLRVRSEMHKDNEWCEEVFNRKWTERIPTLEIFIGVQSQDAPCLFNLQEDDDEFISQSSG